MSVCVCQESSINIFGSIRTHLDEQAVRNIVLPNAKALFYRSSSVLVRRLRLNSRMRIIIIIIILFVQNKMHIKHMNKISKEDNKALRSALTAALNTIIRVQ